MGKRTIQGNGVGTRIEVLSPDEIFVRDGVTLVTSFHPPLQGKRDACAEFSLLGPMNLIDLYISRSGVTSVTASQTVRKLAPFKAGDD